MSLFSLLSSVTTSTTTQSVPGIKQLQLLRRQQCGALQQLGKKASMVSTNLYKLRSARIGQKLGMQKKTTTVKRSAMWHSATLGCSRKPNKSNYLLGDLAV